MLPVSRIAVCRSLSVFAEVDVEGMSKLVSFFIAHLCSDPIEMLTRERRGRGGQLTAYIQTRLTDFSDYRTSADVELTHIGALKTILSEACPRIPASSLSAE
jgi:hypothetical protein